MSSVSNPLMLLRPVRRLLRPVSLDSLDYKLNSQNPALRFLPRAAEAGFRLLELGNRERFGRVETSSWMAISNVEFELLRRR